MIHGDEFLDGLALCLEKYRELERVDSAHELLAFGDVRPKDVDNFYISERKRAEFDKRFAKEGVHPRGHNACSYALAQYASALIKAIEEAEKGALSRTS